MKEFSYLEYLIMTDQVDENFNLKENKEKTNINMENDDKSISNVKKLSLNKKNNKNIY